jgi:hypothetical protein
MAKHLEDIGKDAKDLLNEGYPIDGTVKVTSQTKAFGFVQKETLSKTVKREKSSVKEVVSAAFEPKYELKEQKVEFTGKITTASEINVGTSVRDIVGSGSKVEVNVTRSDRDGINTVGSVSVKKDGFAFKGKVTYPLTPKKATKISGEAVVHHTASNSNVGVAADVSLEGDIARIYTEGVVSHNAVNAQYRGVVRYDVYESSLLWGLSFWQKVSDKNNLAFDITSEDNAVKTSFTAGTEYKVDDSTTVKGKWRLIKTNDRVDYRLGASLKQKLSNHVTIIFGSDLNPRSFLGSGEGEPSTYGVEIKLQD